MPGSNDVGGTVTPRFLLTDHFIYRFSTFTEKMKKTVDLKFDFFWQNARYNFLIVHSSFT